MIAERDAYVNVSGEDFHAGLWTSRPAHSLPPGAATVCRNVDFSRAAGRLAKRRGIQIDQASLGAGSVSGMHQFIQSTGGKFNLASAASNVYKVTGGVWTSIYAGAMAGADCNFVTFSDLAIMVSSTEPTMKWDGAAASMAVLLGTPPANGKCICVWQNRVWIANTSAGKSRLHYSNAGLPEDWTTAGGAGFIDINLNDGDEITGIVPVGPSLYVFKNRTVYRITGVSPTTFQVLPVVLNRGCVAPRSLVAMGPFVIYLSQYGVHSIGESVDGFMSEAIRFDIEALTKTGVCAGRTHDTYVMAYDSDADGKNDSAYVLDLRMGIWTQFTNVKATCFVTRDDGTLTSGGSDLKIIRKHDSGEDDEGGAITMTWRSPKYYFDDFTGTKQLLDAYWNAKAITGKTLTTNVYVDGVLKDTQSAQSLSPLSVGEDIKTLGVDSTADVYGRFIQIEFVNAEVAAPVEITDFNIAAKVTPRQQDA